MGREAQLVGVFILHILAFQETVGFSMKNEQLGKCVQLWEVKGKGRVTLEECRPGLGIQEWLWHPDTQALTSLRTGECLSAPRTQEHEPVRLQSCVAGGGRGALEGQAWGCSKKGHLTLQGKGLHLSARLGSTKVFLSRDRGRASKWRTLANHTVCAQAMRSPSWHHYENTAATTQHTATPTASLHFTSPPASTRRQLRLTGAALMVDGPGSPSPSDREPRTELPPPSDTSTPPTGPSTTFFSLDYGMTWKVAMLVLSALALLLGLTILMLNIHFNRKKKLVCVLKSYSQTERAGQPGRAAVDERAPLTQRPPLPYRSPSLQRGEILIEWKDGTVTPLFDNSSYLTD
ncbi:uncharacterized protein LOC136755389 [Amia ocellicauda]|uniref:uncharacterized protein LOC136755389 n=1 Tax=Amia ocellicauda TaxID=2972642 RepID=UPI0034640EC6